MKSSLTEEGEALCTSKQADLNKIRSPLQQTGDKNIQQITLTLFFCKLSLINFYPQIFYIYIKSKDIKYSIL